MTMPDRSGFNRDERGRFKPGCSGNPIGRPKNRFQIPDILRRIAEEHIEIRGERMSKLEAMLRSTFIRAIKGEHSAVQFVADRMEGKALDRVMQEIDISGGCIVPKAIVP